MENLIQKTKDNKEIVLVSALVSALVCGLIIFAAYFVMRGNDGSKLFGAIATSSELIAQAAPVGIGSESDIIQTVEKANPSVVSIIISKDVPVIERKSRNIGPFTFLVPQENGTQNVEVGGGSGFIVSPEGLVITNKHVVDDPSASYTLFTIDGKKYEVTVVAKDPFYDIAVLKIKNGGLFPHLTFADSDTIKLGQTAIAIGNALAEFRNSVSVGVVSGLSRSFIAGGVMGQAEAIEQAIQTDAAINPGNSGGPLLNSEGNVIGMNVAVAVGSQNIGFALPGNVVKTALDSVKKEGSIVRPYLGVRTVVVTPDLQSEQKLPVDHGELVVSGSITQEGARQPAVVPNSPAAKAGIKEWDILLKVDGKTLDETQLLGQVIRKRSVGDLVFITLNRDGREMSVQAKLEKVPENF